MLIFPATDIYDGKVVRLYKGDYDQMTVYSDNPVEIARSFAACGAEYLHVVDLEGARDGTTPNSDVVRTLVKESGMLVEIGGGIRTEDTVKTYMDMGVARVILGTAAVTDPVFLKKMVALYGERIAVGVDIKDGFVAIKGWTEKSEVTCDAFFEKLQQIGVSTVICTDISKDGALSGTNLQLYRDLSEKYSMQIVASGGISTAEDILALRSMDIYGAILGKALYTGNLNLKEAVKLAKGDA
ncbi:MAG: 1-(5-phosphoribosyl)-5-[(5-phosphoribosylamino)methylideneamino]imidazole-4-carboxamide isomerase [Oscillospiraceae bacterium]|nr:1-(5-phosphoribosyl)-5-[(5-phosphoribosylamino)methylideneamino]imidazole-4-carboxamide isomerase [Oscillospiraceae bacterium]